MLAFCTFRITAFKFHGNVLNEIEIIARNRVTTYIWMSRTGPYFDYILFAVVKGGILQQFLN